VTMLVNVASENNYQLPPEEMYVVTLLAVTDGGISKFNPELKRVKLEWEILLVKKKVVQFDYQTVSLHPKATLSKIARALKVTLPASGQVDLETWVGKKCRIQIEHYDGQDGTKKAKVSAYWPVTAGVNDHGLEVNDDDVPF